MNQLATPDAMVSGLMNTREVAELTTLPAASLRYMRHNNAGPASFKLGRRVVYRRDDVNAWIASQFDETVRGKVATK